MELLRITYPDPRVPLDRGRIRRVRGKNLPEFDGLSTSVDSIRI
jgi:hypothetical protein